MIRVLAGALAFAVFATALWARDDPAKPKPDKPPATPGEEYQALIKEYDTAYQEFAKSYSAAKTDEERAKIAAKYPNPTTYAPRFVALARKNPKDPAAVDALVWVASRAPGGPDGKAALELLQKDHLQSPKMAEVCQSLMYNGSPDADKLLRALKEKNKDHAVQGQATFVLAFRLKGQAEGERKKNPADAGRLTKEAEGLFERVAADFTDVKHYRGTLAEAAKLELFEMRNLAIGKVAPEVAGEDIDGKKLKLTDYRGKVVVLDFWGNW